MTSISHESLVAIVVTHNRPDKLRATLLRLLNSPVSALSALVVVDNASDPETQEVLAEFGDPRLVVIRSEQNEGGAGGFSRGMRIASERFDPDWFVLMDDDGRPQPGHLEAFHQLNKDGWDALAAAVYFPTGEICEMNRPSRNPFWHGAQFFHSALKGRAGFHLKASDYDRKELFQIDVTSFVGFFISRKGVGIAGFPDPSLFIYGDDGIYTLGLSASGGRIAFAPSLRFEHDLSTFSGQRGRFQPLWKAYYYHRNLLILYRKAAGPWFWLVMLIILPRWFLKVKDHSGDRVRFLSLMRRAVLDGLGHRTDVTLSTVIGWATKD
ncbi:MAG: glycosyltransferase [Paracoccaceae bacterium]